VKRLVFVLILNLTALAHAQAPAPAQRQILEDVQTIIGGTSGPSHIGFEPSRDLSARLAKNPVAYATLFEAKYLPKGASAALVDRGQLLWFVARLGTHHRPRALLLTKRILRLATLAAQAEHARLAKVDPVALDAEGDLLKRLSRLRVGARRLRTTLTPTPSAEVERRAALQARDHPRPAFARAKFLFDAGYHQRALDLFLANIRQAPSGPGVDYDHAWAAMCAAQLGQPERTLEHYKVLRQRFPGRVSTGGAHRNWEQHLAVVRAHVQISKAKGAQQALAAMHAEDTAANKRSDTRLRILIRKVASGKARSDVLSEAALFAGILRLIARGELVLR
jgi:tetratricopeptide (TPR) repeat protein